MSQKLCMGNQALAYGAIKAGVQVVCGYPGTPSSEVLLTVAKKLRERQNLPKIHVEWSTNEKAALEVAAGASMCGARTLVAMNQVGLNVAADPLMSLVYLGVKGGMVLVVADDPGPISSQTEQDTRQFAAFAHLPVFDPSTPEDAYLMIQEAYELSERYKTPVIVRPTTRVCHGSAIINSSYFDQEMAREAATTNSPAFERSPDWVIFPQRSYRGHLEILDRLPKIASEFSESPFNAMYDTHATAPSHAGIVASGISYAYLGDVLAGYKHLGALRVLKLDTPYPFPAELALRFLKGLREVLVLEELEPVIERELLQLAGQHGLKTKIFGKLSGHTTVAGENSVDVIRTQVNKFCDLDFFGADFYSLDFGRSKRAAALFGSSLKNADDKNTNAIDASAVGAGTAGVGAGAGEGSANGGTPGAPQLPQRPPVLCAGCPHRASFYAVKRALKGRKAYFSGDIGCYTLGNAMPLDMVDTCLCMGGGFTIPQGMHWVEPDALHLGFMGDATFFASGITGVINAVYNQANVTFCVLDNSTAAMTGSQPHPGTGMRISPDATARDRENALRIPDILQALGVAHVAVVDPLDQAAAQAAVQDAAEVIGVSAVVFRAPCINVAQPSPRPTIEADKCTNCKVCAKSIGCPALIANGDKIAIDQQLCYGCNLCVELCSTAAIVPFAAEPCANNEASDNDNTSSNVDTPNAPNIDDAPYAHAKNNDGIL